MIQRINAVVLKDDYREIYLYELVACVFFLLFSLDVRFGFLTKARPKAVKAVGWLLRAVLSLAVAVLLIFFGKICVGSMIRSAAPAKNVIVLGLALENGTPPGRSSFPAGYC